MLFGIISWFHLRAISDIVYVILISQMEYKPLSTLTVDEDDSEDIFGEWRQDFVFHDGDRVFTHSEFYIPRSVGKFDSNGLFMWGDVVAHRMASLSGRHPEAFMIRFTDGSLLKMSLQELKRAIRVAKAHRLVINYFLYYFYALRS